MKCPYCENLDTKVIDSGPTEEGHAIRRRRGCEKCGKRFTTYEKVEETIIMIIKKDGRREAFDRNKIMNSMVRAFDKRKVSVDVLDNITTEIEQTIQNTLDREVTTDKIGEMIMERLKPLDQVAYIRFASVYRKFQDVGGFIQEINKVLEQK